MSAHPPIVPPTIGPILLLGELAERDALRLVVVVLICSGIMVEDGTEVEEDLIWVEGVEEAAAEKIEDEIVVVEYKVVGVS